MGAWADMGRGLAGGAAKGGLRGAAGGLVAAGIFGTMTTGLLAWGATLIPGVTLAAIGALPIVLGVVALSFVASLFTVPGLTSFGAAIGGLWGAGTEPGKEARRAAAVEEAQSMQAQRNQEKEAQLQAEYAWLRQHPRIAGDMPPDEMAMQERNNALRAHMERQGREMGNYGQHVPPPQRGAGRGGPSPLDPAYYQRPPQQGYGERHSRQPDYAYAGAPQGGRNYN